MIRIHAPAKVNLSLRILAQEESGFHQLETLFARLEFGDLISIEARGEGISVEVDGPYIGPPDKNLVYLAAKGFLELAHLDTGIQIRLEKRIPTQAGLGGGSSDAAAILIGLSELFPGRVEEDALLSLAASLGSDIPFFLAPSPLALAWGRGERVLPLPPLPRAPILLAFPPMGMETPRAYTLLDKSRRGIPPVSAGTLHLLHDFSDWDGVAKLATNDFEQVVFSALPLLKDLKSSLEDTKPRFSLLSGSGSALFAVYRTDEEGESAVTRLKEEFPDVRFVLTYTLELDGVSIPSSGG